MRLNADLARPVYVYRLVVEYPEGSQRWGWAPDGWEKPEWDGNPDADLSFRWPQVRMCLSAGTAKRRAKLLESYGAKVLIERSAPVQFDGGGSDA